MSGEAHLMRQALQPLKSYRDTEAYLRSQRTTRDGQPVFPLSFLDRPTPSRRVAPATNLGE